MLCVEIGVWKVTGEVIQALWTPDGMVDVEEGDCAVHVIFDG